MSARVDRLWLHRAQPSGRLRSQRRYSLPVEKIRPVIRVALRRLHGTRGPGAVAEPLAIPRRIIVDHDLILMLRGQGAVVFDEARYELAPRHLVLIPPFVPHSIVTLAREPSEHLTVHFDLAPDCPPLAHDLTERRPYAVRLAQGLAFPPQVVLPPGHLIEESFTALVRAWAAGGPVNRLVAATQLQRILVALLQWRAGGAAVPAAGGLPLRTEARMERAVAFMIDHLAETLAVSDLARVSGLSPSRFTRLFGEWTGYSPKDYLRRLRVERARELLAHTELPIKEIAAGTGFDDPYHFSKLFHQLDGLSPTQYREAFLAALRRKRN